MSNTTDTPVKSVKNALEIIEAISALDGARIADIADYLDLPESTVYNYLKTLETSGYIVKENGEYRNGLRLLYHGERARSRRDIYEIAKPELKDLAAETGKLANLLVEEHGRGVYIYRTKGTQSTSQHSYIGRHVGEQVYLHSTAGGKAILSQLSEERVDEIVEQHGLPAVTENTIQDRKELAEELEDIRDRGIAYDDEEFLSGLRAVAAPVMRHEKPIGAVSLSGPVVQMNDEQFTDEWPEMIKNITNIIEIETTFS